MDRQAEELHAMLYHDVIPLPRNKNQVKFTLEQATRAQGGVEI
jgi:hypothetical protein